MKTPFLVLGINPAQKIEYDIKTSSKKSPKL